MASTILESLQRYVRWFDSDEGGANLGPLPNQFPIVFCVLVLPFALSAPIRTLTHLPLTIALVISILFCITLGAVLWRRGWRPRPLRETWFWGIVALVPMMYALYVLSARDFGGFPNLDGWDGGTHVHTLNQFVRDQPHAYNGCGVYYALAHFLASLGGISTLRSFALIFYMTVLLCVGLPFLILVGLLRHEALGNRRALGLGLVVGLVSTFVILPSTLFPLLHYNQAFGSYVHVIGFLPVFSLWALDVFIKSASWRLALLVGMLVLMRFTYALNLGDAAIAAAGVILLGIPRDRRAWLHGLVVIGLTALGALAYVALAPVFRIQGGIARFDVSTVLLLHATILGAVVVYVVLVFAGRRVSHGWRFSGLMIALRFPIFFGITSSLAFLLFRRLPRVHVYYLVKYQMQASLLLAFVVVIILAHASMQLLHVRAWRSPRTWLGVMLTTLLLAHAEPVWSKAFAPYIQTLEERARRPGPPYRYLRPLVDEEALRRIPAILTEKHKRFGGYLTWFFPMFSFMNASLGYHTGIQEFFAPDTRPGTCVFWVPPENDTFQLGPVAGLQSHRARLTTGPDVSCITYAVPWKTSPQGLCHRCF